MTEIYSRSYGSIESDGRMRPKITVPPDYHGSMYAQNKKENPEPPSQEKQELSPAQHEPAPARQAPSEPKPQGLLGGLGGLLEKISAEDLIMFGLLFAMLFGDSGDNLALLAVILAILLT